MKLTNTLSIDQEIDSNLVYLQHVADAKWEVARFENDPFDNIDRFTNAARDAARIDRVIKSAEMRRYDALSTTYEKTEALRDILEEMVTAVWAIIADRTMPHTDDPEVHEAWMAYTICLTRLAEVRGLLTGQVEPAA